MKEQPNVLVVDDNSDLLDTFSLILKRRGYNVDTAKEGYTAVDKFKKQRFDVILMDVVMPGMNGVETFRKIAEINPGAKVILMTAFYDENELKGALKEGVYEAVYKPVDIGQLMTLIKEAVDCKPILIVDDDADFCRTMATGLELNGYKSCYATSGIEAVRLAESNEFEAAFIDMKMPGMDGLETCLRLKEVDRDLFTVVMTGYRDETQEKINKANAAACLYKPFDINDVLEFIKK